MNHRNGNVVGVVMTIKVKAQNVKHATLVNQRVHYLKPVSVTRREIEQDRHRFDAIDHHLQKPFTSEQVPQVHGLLAENHLLQRMKINIHLRKTRPNKDQHIQVGFFFDVRKTDHFSFILDRSPQRSSSSSSERDGRRRHDQSKSSGKRSPLSSSDRVSPIHSRKNRDTDKESQSSPKQANRYQPDSSPDHNDEARSTRTTTKQRKPSDSTYSNL